jgi:hypothetical protein
VNQALDVEKAAIRVVEAELCATVESLQEAVAKGDRLNALNQCLQDEIATLEGKLKLAQVNNSRITVKLWWQLCNVV